MFRPSIFSLICSASTVFGLVIPPMSYAQTIDFQSISSRIPALLTNVSIGISNKSNGAIPAIGDVEREALRRDPLGKIDKRQAAYDRSQFPNAEDASSATFLGGPRPLIEIANKVSDSIGTTRVQTILPERATNADGLRIVRGRHRTTSLIEAVDLSDSFDAPLDHHAKARSFLRNNRKMLGLLDPDSEFIHTQTQLDFRGQKRFRFKQMYRGIPVFGQEASIYVDSQGAINAFRGTYRPTPKIADVIPVITSEVAQRVVSSQHDAPADFYKTGLVLLPDSDGDEIALAWHIEAYIGPGEGWHYFVDAKTGVIVKRFSAIQHGSVQATGIGLDGSAKTFPAWQNGSTYYMIDVTRPQNHTATANPIVNALEPGDVKVYDCKGRSTNAPCQMATSLGMANGWNAASVSGLTGAEQVVDYYRNTHSRVGLDGQGTTITIVVNDGSNPNNAHWNSASRIIVLGTGDSTFRNLALGLDVIAHELTHGVISATANLTYDGQSGALNESFADFFGSMVDRQNWTMGESVVQVAPGFLRDMANPHNGLSECGNPAFAQPSHLREYVNLRSDNGGVHCNSGIPNRAAYLIAEGLSNEGLGTSLGRSQTEQIYYYALTHLMHPSDQFLDTRHALIAAATTIYGANAAATVASAWDAVGVLEPPQVPANSGARLMTDADRVVGANALLYVGTNSGIYVENSSGRFGPINQFPATQARPAVYFNSTSNDGFILYANAATGSMRAVRLSNSVDTLVTSGNFQAFAVSQDGSTLAWISSNGDSNLYVLPASGAVQTLPIRIETQDGGAQDVGAIPDTLSFDYRGEHILFDFAIPFKDAVGNANFRWAIGNFDLLTGRMTTTASFQPPNINVGNPVYATNNDYIIAFDAIDTSTNQSLMAMANANTNELQPVANPDLNGLSRSTSGHPVFNDADSSIAFQTRYTYCPSACTDFDPYYISQVPISKSNGSWSVSATPTQLSSLYGVGYPQMLKLGSRSINASISASTALVDFGQVQIGSSKSFDITISNTGNVDVSITNLAISGADFSTGGSTGLVPRNMSVAVPISFTPTGNVGSRSATLSITSDATLQQSNIVLSGIAAAPPAISTTTTTTTSSTTTSQVVTTTTTASTTTTTVPAQANLTLGWNLLGNGMSNAIVASNMFGNSSIVSTVWKWIASSSAWAFYTPTLTDGGAAYAASKGYTFLTTINAGEGFWVNAKNPFSVQLSGSATPTSGFADAVTGNALPSGWSLIAIGDNKTPSGFANLIALIPPAAGTSVATSLTTLWAWDAELTGWYFFAPSLVNAGTQASYIASKGYLDFGAKTLTPTTGFWVNHP